MIPVNGHPWRIPPVLSGCLWGKCTRIGQTSGSILGYLENDGDAVTDGGCRVRGFHGGGEGGYFTDLLMESCAEDGFSRAAVIGECSIRGGEEASFSAASRAEGG